MNAAGTTSTVVPPLLERATAAWRALIPWLRRRLTLGRGRACSFCGERPARWTFPHTESGTPHLLTDGWIACDSCHPLVEQRDREALARRAAERLEWTALSPSDFAQAMRHARLSHERFFATHESPRGHRLA